MITGANYAIVTSKSWDSHISWNSSPCRLRDQSTIQEHLKQNLYCWIQTVREQMLVRYSPTIHEMKVASKTKINAAKKRNNKLTFAATATARIKISSSTFSKFLKSWLPSTSIWWHTKFKNYLVIQCLWSIKTFSKWFCWNSKSKPRMLQLVTLY